MNDREKLKTELMKTIQETIEKRLPTNEIWFDDIAEAALTAIENAGYWLAPDRPDKEMDFAIISGLMNNGQKIGKTLQDHGLDINVFWSIWHAAKSHCNKRALRDHIKER